MGMSGICRFSIAEPQWYTNGEPLRKTAERTGDLRMDRLYRVREAAALLAIGHTRMYELINARQIKTCRIGDRGVRIAESEINRFIRERMDAAELAVA